MLPQPGLRGRERKGLFWWVGLGWVDGGFGLWWEQGLGNGGFRAGRTQASLPFWTALEVLVV